MKEIEKAIADIEAGYHTDFTNKMSLQALQEKAERDKMRCVNCRYEPKNPTSETLPCSMCSVAYASYFEAKED